MSDYNLISPLLDNYIVGDPINEKFGIRCCPALERDSENKCIVKIISTPASQSQLDALLLSGAYPDAQSALRYFQTIADGIIDEAQTLQRLAQLEGFISYIGWQLAPMTGNVGFDVYTISEYRKTLFKLLRSENMTHLAAVNLGLDLCTALAVCRRIGHIYINLKPENIYLADNGTWKIGDIGFVRLDSLKYTSLPERYRSEYTAPEIADAFASLNTTLDVYALGLVLYKIYNANQLPTNWKSAGKEPFLPPDYADYEMSEIILKACDPDPEKRWQDPIEMGQALVSYMQRNAVNDTPIVPPALSAIPPTENTDAEQNGTTEEIADPTADNLSGTQNEVTPQDTETDNAEDPVESASFDSETENIAILLTPSEDETAPEQNKNQLDNISVTDEVSGMLLQADDLIAHAAPDMSNLTDVDSTFDDDESEPTPEVENASPAVHEEHAQDQLEQSTNAEDNCDSSLSLETENVVDPISDSQLESDIVITNESSVDEVDESTGETSIDTAEAALNDTVNETAVPEIADITEEITEPREDAEEPIVVKKSHWLRNLIIGCVLAILALLAFLFYTRYYLQTIDTLSVVKSSDGSVTINISTQADESTLSVVCSDAQGTPMVSSFQGGTAVFTNLKPGTAYTVKIEINGFRKLTGKTSTAFTTPDIMQILDLTAVTGDEDGSVIINFTTKNQDCEDWSISYVNDNGDQVIENFDGHCHMIKDLTVGNTYTFTLQPESDIEYTGTSEVTHLASAVIAPTDLRIESLENGTLTICWSSPEPITVEKWIVTCIGDKGYEKNTELVTTTATFDAIDTTEAYTIKVSAAGMSVTSQVSLPANPVSITSFEATENGTELILNWQTGGSTEQSDWVLFYQIGNTAEQELPCTQTNQIVLENRIPDATYTFRLKNSDGSDILGGRMTYQTSAAEAFSGYHVKASDMRFYSCRTPNKSNWSKKDLSNSDYTSTFKIGEKASYLASLSTTYNTSKDPISTMFVFRNESGQIVTYSGSTRTWTQMWYKGLCELDIPLLPDTPGKYTVSIYMNGMLAGISDITISA